MLRQFYTSASLVVDLVTEVEQTSASKLRRGQPAFVHEVVKTDASKRIDQISEVDATAATLEYFARRPWYRRCLPNLSNVRRTLPLPEDVHSFENHHLVGAHRSF